MTNGHFNISLKKTRHNTSKDKTRPLESKFTDLNIFTKDYPEDLRDLKMAKEK